MRRALSEAEWAHLLLRDMLAEEFPHQRGDLVAIRLQREVACVEQVKLEGLQVALVRFGSVGRKDLVILAPGDQHWRLVLAEVLLPLRIEWRVAAVAQEQVELNLV